MNTFLAGCAFAAIGVLAGAASAAPPVLDPSSAKAAFAEARAPSDRDGGTLWGMALYGPMMYVDPESRVLIANVPDADGILHAEDGVYVGRMPDGMFASNTALEWHGVRWTMVTWPLWGDALTREKLLEHELFHRIQPSLHLQIGDRENPHLDTLEGRLWLQLEWRALAAALASDGTAQIRAAQDALTFRAHRQAMFPGSRESERTMEINESLAEYTGLMLSSPDAASARWRAIDALLHSDVKTYVRSFPYASGPAYALLLDARAPGWRTHLTGKSDLAGMLASALPRRARADESVRAAAYGAAALRRSETERAVDADAARAGYRARLVDGPTLMLPHVSDTFCANFDPRELVPLGDAGTVYPKLQVRDGWGVLTAKAGALMPGNYTRVTVTAPDDPKGSHIAGNGWTLELAPGWRVVPGGRPGSYTVEKQP